MKDSKGYEEAARRVKKLPRIFGRVSEKQLQAEILGKHVRTVILNSKVVFIPDNAEYEELPDGTRKLSCLFYGYLYFEKEEEDEALHDHRPD